MIRMTGVSSLAVAVILATTTGLSAAAAAPGDPSSSSRANSPRAIERVTLHATYAPYEDVPADVYKVATDLTLAFPDTSLVWDDTDERITAWISGPADVEGVSALVASSGVRGIDVQVAAYERDALELLANEIVVSGVLDGADISWAGPRADGSGLDVGVQNLTTSAAARTAQQPEYAGVPVTLVTDGEVARASRDYDLSPFMAGADMVRDAGGGYVSYCSTAFAFTHMDLATGVVSERLFTADHCGPTGAVWRTGRSLANPIVGTSESTFTAQNDLKSLSGGDYRPYMYYGANTSNSAVAIFGYVTPIVGAIVCYGGAPSGTVCGNEVTHTGLTVSYTGAGTYQDLTRTVQTSGTPAVGNGDSGGPAFVIATGGYVYAAGIISGMSGAGSTCTGDASTATRKCSATVFFAPVVDYFQYNEPDSIQTYD